MVALCPSPSLAGSFACGQQPRMQAFSEKTSTEDAQGFTWARGVETYQDHPIPDHPCITYLPISWGGARGVIYIPVSWMV